MDNGQHDLLATGPDAGPPRDAPTVRPAATPTEPVDELRRLAVKRLEDKRGLTAHALAYVTVNLLIVAVWMATGAHFFWPLFPLFGWGIGLAFHAWGVLWPEPGPKEIDREIERIQRRRS